MSLPPDHNERMQRARLALEGLSVGDAFGERFFSWPPEVVSQVLAGREMRERWWRYTDDTEMALAIMQILASHGRIEQDELASTFASRYARDDRRGYGAGAHWLLMELGKNQHWRQTAPQMFGGTGSLGNGGAMRAAPVGAYFADDYDIAAEQARLSAEVTHFHPEGQSGAIAVALAAAWCWQNRQRVDSASGKEMLQLVRERMPHGMTRDNIELAIAIENASVETAARRLGSGQRVTAPDTVPFCLWIAARHLDNYAEAIWETVSVFGDVDTNCAIVGGIMAMSAGAESIPAGWIAAREELKLN